MLNLTQDFYLLFFYIINDIMTWLLIDSNAHFKL